MNRIVSILFLLLGCVLMNAQERNELVDSAAVRFLQTAENFSALYYGFEYEGLPRTLNHPYLKNDDYTKARLVYKHIMYPEALLRLDLYRDELVVRSPGFRNITLFPENVAFAELHGKHIIYRPKDEWPGCPPNGYYFLLYEGDCKIFEKRIALLIEKTSPGLLERYFEFSTRYYLLKDNVYYQIRNKTGLLKALTPYKKELKRFISSRKLNFRNDAEQFLILTVNEYERISK